MASERQRYEQRLEALRSDRSTVFTEWQELSDYILPRRGRYLRATQSQQQKSRTGRIIDPSATLAARDLASGLKAGITSKARPWFRLTLADRDLADDDEVKLYLSDVEQRVRRVMDRSNFYTSIHTLYENLAVFGTGSMVVVEDFNTVVRFVPLATGEAFLANGADGHVQTLYREFYWSIGQCAEMFGVEKLSHAAQSLYRSGNFDAQIEVIQAIEPNRDKGRFSHVSCYWERGANSDIMLGKKGYQSFPAMCPRWYLEAGETYGRSPGTEALPSIKALQTKQKKKGQAIAKMVDPPMVASEAMRNQRASVLPGDVTYVAGATPKDSFFPAYQVNFRVDQLAADIADDRDIISKFFFVDLFRMISQLDTVRTAAEIAARQEEKLLMLGPVLERLDDELLDPTINRVIEIMERRLLLPPRPDVLKGHSLAIEYVSVLAQAQRAVSTSGIERLVGFAGNLAAARPDVLDKVDLDQAIDQYATALGVDPSIVVPDDKVQAIRQARADKQQAMETAQQGLAAVQGAKVLSETQTGAGQNALQQMLGSAGMMQ